MGLEVEIRKGSPGQFDVLADGELVASKKKSFLSHFTGGGWPDPAEVVAALHKRSLGVRP